MDKFSIDSMLVSEVFNMKLLCVSVSDLLPSSWIFVLYTSVLRVIEGVGTGMFTTVTFTILPDLFPNSVATVSVR